MTISYPYRNNMCLEILKSFLYEYSNNQSLLLSNLVMLIKSFSDTLRYSYSKLSTSKTHGAKR